MFCQTSDPLYSLVGSFQKCFRNSETAATKAATAVVDAYYVKTAKMAQIMFCQISEPH